MRRSSIVAKLWLAFTALILVVMIPLEFALHRMLSDFYSRQVTEPLLYHSHQLAQMLAYDSRHIASAASVGQMVGGQVMVLDARGEQVSINGAPPLPAPRAAAAKALAGDAYAGEATLQGGASYIVTAVPIPGDLGAVLLFAPAEPVQASLKLARRYLWLAGAGTLLLGTGLALVLSRHLLQPVIAIERATRLVAKGDLTVRVPVRSQDELGQLAQAVNQMTAQLAAYENRRREFLANVAHELRTPLSYVRGYTQALAEGLITEPQDRARYQRVVHEEAIRIGRLVDDLMDIAQIDEGQMGFQRSQLDLRIPAEQALATIQPLAEEKGVRVQSELSADLPQVLADGGRVQQVVFNLLDNALRHTPAGGEITLRMRCGPEWVTVSVSDSGPGIPPDLLPLVFERFQKQDSTGRGLGLAIVRSIINAHQGEVSARNNPGGGALFEFRLQALPRA